MGDIAYYTLMNKNTPVLVCDYSLVANAIIGIRQIINPEYAPLAISKPGSKGACIEAVYLNLWWQARALPRTRDHLEQALAILPVGTVELLRRNWGLSLSDQYWLDNAEDPRDWASINFFSNDFSNDVGRALFGKVSFEEGKSDGFSLRTPDASTGGDLAKYWVASGDKRYLVKAGHAHSAEEVFNELIATRLYARLLSDNEYVAYEVFAQDGTHYCRCENMVDANHELIPAKHVGEYFSLDGNEDLYAHITGAYNALGITNGRQAINKMLVCDAILANWDRHYNNFGVIRDVQTLKVTGVAPIYDNGNSMFSNKDAIGNPWDYTARPFKQDPLHQLALAGDCPWFDPHKLEGFTSEVREILMQSPMQANPTRMDKLLEALQSRINYVTESII